MSDTPELMDAGALLADMRWARGIALSLVADEHLADEVVQEAWYAAVTGQCTQADPGAPFGLTLSNGLEIRYGL